MFGFTRLVLFSALATLAVARPADSGEAPATPTRDHSQSPIGELSVLVNSRDREAYFSSLRAFAEKYSFAIRVAPVDPSGERFIVQMFREDLKAISTDAMQRGRFSLDFYVTCGNDVDSITRENLKEMLDDLRVRLSHAHGVTIVPNG